MSQPSDDLSGTTAPGPPPPLRPEVRARIGDRPTPVRPPPPRRVQVALVITAGVLASLIGVLVHPSAVALADRGLPLLWWLATMLLWTGGAAVLSYVALAESEPRVATKSTRRALLLVMLAAAYVVAAVIAQTVTARGDLVAGRMIGGACLGTGFAIAIVPAAVLIWLLRRGHTFRPVRAGALLGAAAGFWALGALEACPCLLAKHKLASHLSVVGVLACAGAVGGFAWRRARVTPIEAK
jgi:hypothetical protein